MNLPEKCASFHRTQIIVFQLVVYIMNNFFIHIPNFLCMLLYWPTLRRNSLSVIFSKNYFDMHSKFVVRFIYLFLGRGVSWLLELVNLILAFIALMLVQYICFLFLYHTLTFAPAPEVKVTVLFTGVTLLYVMGQICYPSHEAYSEGSCSWYFYQTARGRTWTKGQLCSWGERNLKLTVCMWLMIRHTLEKI